MQESMSVRSYWLNVIKIAGAWISFCIGSGFATGQELLQYFGGYGVMGFAGIGVAMLLHAYAASAFLKLGKEKNFDRPIDVFDYYCGKHMGYVFKLLSIFFLFLSPVVMIAGFGAALNQHFGISVVLGNSIMGVLAFLTLVLGLKRMVEIIGAIGPAIIFITLLSGGIYLWQHWPTLQEGMAAAPKVQELKMGSHWIVAGLLYAAWAPMISAPFLVTSATTVDTPKEAAAGGIWGTVFYGIACCVMVMAFFTTYTVIQKQAVPTLYLAHTISPLLGIAFLAIIFLGIYSSTVPSLLTFCVTFFKEKTPKYNIFSAVVCVAATITSIVMPFGNLLNLVYTVYGYLGMIFFVLLAVKQFQNKKNSQ